MLTITATKPAGTSDYLRPGQVVFTSPADSRVTLFSNADEVLSIDVFLTSGATAVMVAPFVEVELDPASRAEFVPLIADSSVNATYALFSTKHQRVTTPGNQPLSPGNGLSFSLGLRNRDGSPLAFTIRVGAVRTLEQPLSWDWNYSGVDNDSPSVGIATETVP